MVIVQIVKTILHQLKLVVFQERWKRMHDDSGMIPQNIFPIELVRVGKMSYGELNVITFNDKTKLEIGNYVSIAQNVYFMLDVEHSINGISTFPFKVKALGIQRYESFSKGDIVVGDDVWIGFGAMIMSGVTIGQGAVVAAASVVTKDVPPYAVVAGVPAKVIKYRVQETLIDNLLNMDFAKLNIKQIEKHIEELYNPLSSLEQLEWFPIKVSE